MTQSVIYAHAATLWRQMRRDYQDVLEAQYAAAEHATNGYMVNARGRAAGWSGWRIFTAPPTVLAAYGSPELVEHLRDHPRTTLAAYEAGWFDTTTEADTDGHHDPQATPAAPAPAAHRP